MKTVPNSASRWSPPTQAKAWLYGAAALSVVAGMVHLLVAPEHFAEWIGYGLFFIIVALAQLVYPVLLVRRRPSRKLLLYGIVGNGLLIALYIVTRTVGVPYFGPAAGEVETVGFLDVVSKLAELALIVCLAVLLRAELFVRPGAHQSSS